MNIVEHVRIEGFWGDRVVDLPFKRDVNFLIGVNGSGKTTVINLLAAALTGDFSAILRAPFERLIIDLRDTETGEESVLKLAKEPSSDMPFPRITYQLPTADDQLLLFPSGAVEDHIVLRESSLSRHYPELRKRQARSVTEQLRTLIRTSWLSIHRSKLVRDSRDEASFESTVDKKLDDVANSLVRYFSSLERRGAELVDGFQREMLLSLLTYKSANFAIGEVRSFDLAAEKVALTEILKSTRLPESQYADALADHFVTVTGSLERLSKEEGKEFTHDDLMTILDTVRIHSVVQQWRALATQQTELFAPRQNFLATLSSLFQRKDLQVNERNEIVAHTTSGKILGPKDFSSGEKQLFIILAEALLQEGRPHVYIADEPELSLHVSWQESLVDKIRELNPSAQLIIATHSPDIVGRYSDRVLNMSQYIQ